MKASVPFLSIIILLSLASLPSFNFESEASTESKVVFCEEITATWCTGCPNTAEALYKIYGSDSSFYYVAMVTDKNEKAADRIEDYNIAGYPTSFFDGGYSVVFGGKSDTAPYKSAINECRNRAYPNVGVVIDVGWLGESSISISIKIENNGGTYHGHLRAYVVEPVSRWNNLAGNPYHFGFLDYALDKDVSIEGVITEETVWNGSSAGYEDITRDNIMVIAALFDAEGHTGYSDPPSNNHRFTAHYVDSAAAASPPEDSPPSVMLIGKPASVTGYRNATFSWEGKDDFTSSDELLYSYMLIGYDSRWSEWGQETEKDYESLADGKYTFMVKVKDDGGQESTVSWQFTVDTSPPTVVSTDPADNSKDKDIFSPVTIAFSYNMDKSSVSNAISIDLPIDYSIKWNSDKVLVISPKNHWMYKTVYTITLSGSIRRDSGQEMGKPYELSFETSSADTESPEIISTYPGNGGTAKSGDVIKIQFSEPMEIRFFEKAIRNDPWFSYHIEWEDNDTALKIIPRFLPPGEYKIMITTYAMDKSGNHMGKKFTIGFEVMPPRVLCSLPYDGEREVPVSTKISIVFSEEMDKGSMGGNISATFDFSKSWNENGDILYIIPSAPLEHEKHYSIEIDRNATNIYGTKLDSSYTVSLFTEGKMPDRHIGEETPSFTLAILLCAIIFSLILYRRS